MKVKNFFNFSRSLSARERGLQITRLVTSFAVIVLIIAALVGSLLSKDIYISRINCAHLDVSYGLYKSLRNLVSTSPSILQQENSAGVYPMDSTLTNSEITVLTNYAEEQVANAAQYTYTSLWRWCYGNYNVSQVLGQNGKYTYKKHNDVVKCSNHAKEYVFDYRRELADIGLESILAYAYQTNTYDDDAYLNATESRHQKYKKVPGALIFTAVSQALLLILTYIVYLDRGDDPKVRKQQMFFMNFLALISMASFFAMAIGVGFMTHILIDAKLEVEQSLKDFGVTFHFGKVWFSLLWASFIFSLLSMSSWTLPLWCANPPEDMDEDMEAGLPQNYKRSTNRRSGQGEHLRRASNPHLNLVHEVHDYHDDPLAQNTESDSFHRPIERKPTFTTEEELRKLGESLSRSVSVRHLNRKPSGKKSYPTFTPVTEDPFDSASLLEQDDQDAHHYREETYDGYQNRQRYPQYGRKHDRNVLASLNTQLQTTNDHTDANSFLDEDEIHFLDHNNFINKM